MRLIISGYETEITLAKERANVLVFNETNQLYQFRNKISDVILGVDDKIKIIIHEKILNVESEVVLISDVLSINLNEKKMVTSLQKSVANEIGKSDYILSYNELHFKIVELIKMIRKSMLVNFTFDDEVNIDKIIKLFDLKYINEKELLSIQFHKYIELLVLVSKVKVLFITSALYYFNDHEIGFLVDLCIEKGITVVFLEKQEKNQNLKRDDCVIIDMELLF